MYWGYFATKNRFFFFFFPVSRCSKNNGIAKLPKLHHQYMQ